MYRAVGIILVVEQWVSEGPPDVRVAGRFLEVGGSELGEGVLGQAVHILLVLLHHGDRVQVNLRQLLGPCFQILGAGEREGQGSAVLSDASWQGMRLWGPGSPKTGVSGYLQHDPLPPRVRDLSHRLTASLGPWRAVPPAEVVSAAPTAQPGVYYVCMRVCMCVRTCSGERHEHLGAGSEGHPGHWVSGPEAVQ